MIIATAGHIDHGKTLLVKALTGQDTDRLPQERARGITIDLGFAHLDAGPGTRISFIDVPGHERFIRNMIAGVAGIDAALVVVAADDGIMPQTLEHIHILDLLNVPRGAVAISKKDLVPPQRVEVVSAEIKAVLAGTSLAGAPVFPVSALRGQGLDALTAWMKSVALNQAHADDSGHHFRMPVDRAFTIAGSGTVVTGTVRAGTVAAGDQLAVSPGGDSVRVRGIQIHGAPAQAASAGQRCALNLAGASLDDVKRGDWVVHPAVQQPTARFEARLHVLDDVVDGLQHRTPVQLHHGAGSVAARIVMSPAGARIAAGAAGYAQIIADKPIPALHGDRFIIRSQDARHTLAGGVVLDPYAPTRRQRPDARLARMQIFERSGPQHILAGLLEADERGVDWQEFVRAMNLTPAAAADAQRAADAVLLGRNAPVAISRTATDALTARLLAALRSFHAQHPQSPGMESAALHARLAPGMAAEAFQAFVRVLANRKLIVLSNDIARMCDHESSANAQDDALWERVRGALREAGVQVPLLADLASQIAIPEGVLRDFLHRKSRTGLVWRVTDTRFCLQETLMSLAAAAVELSAGKEDGLFSAADFRDVIGTGRGLAIHYLEFFDRVGITRRFGDRRTIGKDYQAVLDPDAGA